MLVLVAGQLVSARRAILAVVAWRRTAGPAYEVPGSEAVVVPVLDCPEQAVRSLEHHSRMGSGGALWFAASARDCCGTAEALGAAGAQVVVAPRTAAGKAAQVNWAVRQIPPTDWITVYDVDSAPATARLAIGRRAANLDVVTRRCVYRPAGESPFWNGVALAQTWWGVTYESGKWLGRRWYLVGHGVTIRRELLEREPLDESATAEDLAYGYRISAQGKRVGLSPDADRALSPDGFREYVRQARRWFYGDVQATRELDEPSRTIRRAELLWDWLAAPVLTPIALLHAPALAPLGVLKLLAATAMAGTAAARLSDVPVRHSPGALVLGFAARRYLFAVAALTEAGCVLVNGARCGPFSPTQGAVPDDA
ncbi:glycosyltransferase family 2 protein [Blastococcus sp. BMG 814]|uniref:Glycosyltransferase family 2 protein n=1 Tax=Blastococcus carthaginiensis TaxID=3050034 RepID=A0ABT9I9T6_9ACTN|nr:glycosyltransferase family 2 protein [Blastococcus carthaginiensis]MDP5182329.1 glycosyltransferase family 2 protein [Blastococcus carthaginiensis]